MIHRRGRADIDGILVPAAIQRNITGDGSLLGVERLLEILIQEPAGEGVALSRRGFGQLHERPVLHLDDDGIITADDRDERHRMDDWCGNLVLDLLCIHRGVRLHGCSEIELGLERCCRQTMSRVS